MFIEGCFQVSIGWSVTEKIKVFAGDVPTPMAALEQFCGDLPAGDLKQGRALRCMKLLERLDLKTWDDVNTYRFSDIRSARNFGRVSYSVLGEVAETYGIKVRNWFR